MEDKTILAALGLSGLLQAREARANGDEGKAQFAEGAADLMFSLSDGMSTEQAIVRQEKAGQQTLVRHQLWPKRCKGATREQLETLGFQFGEDYDNLFVNVTLPEGWEIRPSDHDMWSYLYDEQDRCRASIFYKAAFYDRHAFVRMEKE